MAEVVSTLVFEAKTGALKETKRALDDVAHSANDAAKEMLMVGLETVKAGLLSPLMPPMIAKKSLVEH